MKTSPCNYKTPYGLFQAFVRCLGLPPSCAKAWWLHNAIWHAEENMKDHVLVSQLRRLADGSSPKTIEDLIPIGHSIGV